MSEHAQTLDQARIAWSKDDAPTQLHSIQIALGFFAESTVLAMLKMLPSVGNMPRTPLEVSIASLQAEANATLDRIATVVAHTTAWCAVFGSIKESIQSFLRGWGRGWSNHERTCAQGGFERRFYIDTRPIDLLAA